VDLDTDGGGSVVCVLSSRLTTSSRARPKPTEVPSCCDQNRLFVCWLTRQTRMGKAMFVADSAPESTLAAMSVQRAARMCLVTTPGLLWL
jgi:hypothetical protein